MSVLLTGFDPFGGERINPSWEAVRGFHGQSIGGLAITTLQLPTAFGVASDMLQAEIIRLAPSVCICVGQAGGSAAIALERVAVNLADARIPDNIGQQPKNQSLIQGAPAAYFAPLNLAPLLHALEQAHVPAHISLSAGSFVCNAVFFQLCHLAQTRPQLRGVFVHIPYAPEQVQTRPELAAMPTMQVQQALAILIETAILQ
jgi:pyroglutamyl-peptidase